MTLLYNADAGAGGGGAAPAAAAPAGQPAAGSGGSLLTAIAPGAPAAPDWRTGIPDEFKNDPSIASIKSVADLAKGYVHAQRLVGVDKIPAPNDKWTEAQWAEHHDRMGRPKTPADYPEGTVKLKEGINVKTEDYTKAKTLFHSLGLNAKQAAGVLDLYNTTLNEGHDAQQGQLAASRESTMQALTKEWGPNINAKLELAKATLQKFGGHDLIEHLDSSGLGNNPQLIKMLEKIGSVISEDRIDGKGIQLDVSNSTTAVQEISRLKIDKDFQRALNTANDPGHADAVERWRSVFKQAYPGTPVL